ncbi:MAG: hypothetical protein ACXAE3_17675 [Candidatus Kariarchaeaceae archaeon]|jgi:hypothetical protein
MSERFFQTIIIQTNAGIPYFEVGASDTQKDSVLIGGFSRALSTVWSNFVQSDEEGFEIIERAEDKICMIAHRTKNSTMLLIGSVRPSSSYQRRIERAHKEIEGLFPEIINLNNQGVYKDLPHDRTMIVFQNYGLHILETE